MIIPKNLFVFDIETIRDKQLFVDVKGKEDETFENIIEEERKRLNRKSIKDVFVSNPYHKVVCVSYLRKMGDKRNFESWCGSENEVLKIFWAALGVVLKEVSGKNTDIPYIITFNGKRFDIPVIIIRSLRYLDYLLNCKGELFNYIDIALKTYFSTQDKWEDSKPNYTKNYSKFNLDLMEHFGPGVSLETLCKICGISVKSEGNGSEVEEYYYNGDYEKIARYCAEDVRATYNLYLNMLLIHHAKSGYEEIKSEIKKLKLLKSEIKRFV